MTASFKIKCKLLIALNIILMFSTYGSAIFVHGMSNFMTFATASIKKATLAHIKTEAL